MGDKIQHAVYATHKAFVHGLPLEVAHIVNTHTQASNVRSKTLEGAFLFYADNADSDAATIPVGGAFFAPRPLRAGQAAAAAPAAGVATFLLPRYASPVAIMAHTMRAILLARATAASLRGLRSSNASSQAEAVLLPGLA